MIRTLAALTLLASALGAAAAQEATPATPAPADIVVDPTASIGAPPQANLLTGLYATLVTIDICDITVEPAVRTGMDTDRKRLETALGLDATGVTEAYARVESDMRTVEPDCAEGSPDRASVDAVTAIYADQQATQPTTSTPQPGTVNITMPTATPTPPAQ
jgi:hypothetical protein